MKQLIHEYKQDGNGIHRLIVKENGEIINQTNWTEYSVSATLITETGIAYMGLSEAYRKPGIYVYLADSEINID